MISFAKKRPLYVYARNEWAKVVESWVKKNAPTARFIHMGKHLMFWEYHAKFNQQFDRFLNGLD